MMSSALNFFSLITTVPARPCLPLPQQSTQNQTAVRIAREAELRGAQLSAWSSREYTSYTAQFLRQDLPEIGHTLAETVAGAFVGRGKGEREAVGGVSEGMGFEDLFCYSQSPSILIFPVPKLEAYEISFQNERVAADLKLMQADRNQRMFWE